MYSHENMNLNRPTVFFTSAKISDRRGKPVAFSRCEEHNGTIQVKLPLVNKKLKALNHLTLR